jgi:uncharacterized protein (DUF2141 family)
MKSLVTALALALCLICQTGFALDGATVRFHLKDGTGKQGGVVFPNSKIVFYQYSNKAKWEADESVVLDAHAIDPVTFVVKGLPEGVYTFSAFQDLNHNGEHDRNLAGFPKEPFAISRIIKKLWSAPPWEEVNCQVKAGQTLDLDLFFKYQ